MIMVVYWDTKGLSLSLGFALASLGRKGEPREAEATKIDIVNAMGVRVRVRSV